MKLKTIILLTIFFLFQNCKSIKVLDSYNYNFYFFSSNKMNSLNSYVYQEKNILLLKKRKERYIYDANFLKKQFTFVKHNDTMRIYCICFDAINYYLKNLEFKKGSYYVDYNYNELREVNSSELKATKRVEKIIFEDYLNLSKKPALPKNEIKRKNVLFKELKFSLIDFSDTINVRLALITKEEFWSNDFIPKNLKE